MLSLYELDLLVFEHEDEDIKAFEGSCSPLDIYTASADVSENYGIYRPQIRSDQGV